MDSMKHAFAAAAAVVANPITINQEEMPTEITQHPPVTPATVTLTQESLTALIQAATQAAIAGLLAQAQAPAVVPAPTAEPAPGLRQATQPEVCAAHKFLSLLNRGVSSVIVGTRDHVVVPANLYLVDQAAPQALAVVAAGSIQVAAGAAKLSGYFARLATKAAAKSLALSVQ